MSRERIQVFQLDAPLCEHTFGTSPCTASGAAGSECYNTLKTCQDTANYSEVTTRYYFGTECEAVYMDSANWYPTLQGVRRRAAEINIVSIDPDKAPLGRRESVKVTLRDIPHHDRGTDPYYSTRSYVSDTLTQGTFWSKWQGRNDNYDGLTCKVYEGYAGQDLCSMRQYHLLLDRIDGPGSDETVTVTAKDILKAADDVRVKIPTPNTGKLDAALTDSATSFDVGSGEGSQYAASGTLSIGDEAMTFTRSTDTFTVVRGAWDTTAVAHNENDLVQQAYETDGARVDNIVKDMLLNFCNIPTAWIDATAWDSEGDDWIPTYVITTAILKPTGANELIGELLRDSACYLVPDSRNKKIHFNALRPSTVTTALTDNDNIISNSFKIVRKPELRLTQLFYWYDMNSINDNPKQVKNFRKAHVELSDDVNEARTQRDKSITSRFFQSANTNEIEITAGRIMTRYGREPIEFHFEIDAKDTEGSTGLKLGDTCVITHRGYTDETGAAEPISMQIISIQDQERGHKSSIKAQPFEFNFAARLWTGDGHPDWTSSTDEQRGQYGYWSDENGNMSDGADAPTWL